LSLWWKFLLYIWTLTFPFSSHIGTKKCPTAMTIA
jgi:hypothetical protein